MDVRGAGANTEIIIDANSGTIAVVLKPVDDLLSSFVSSSFAQTYGSGSIGRSLEFGQGPTFWQKRKGARLQLSSYDLATQSSMVLTNYDKFPVTLGPVAVDTSKKLLAGIDFATDATLPDTLDLYDVSDFNNPLLIGKYDFPVIQRPNANFIGQVIFTGDRVFALDGNNGVAAFTILPPGAPSPALTVVRTGPNVVLSWPAARLVSSFRKHPLSLHWSGKM